MREGKSPRCGVGGREGASWRRRESVVTDLMWDMMGGKALISGVTT